MKYFFLFVVSLPLFVYAQQLDDNSILLEISKYRESPLIRGKNFDDLEYLLRKPKNKLTVEEGKEIAELKNKVQRDVNYVRMINGQDRLFFGPNNVKVDSVPLYEKDGKRYNLVLTDQIRKVKNFKDINLGTNVIDANFVAEPASYTEKVLSFREKPTNINNLSIIELDLGERDFPDYILPNIASSGLANINTFRDLKKKNIEVGVTKTGSVVPIYDGNSQILRFGNDYVYIAPPHEIKTDTFLIDRGREEEVSEAFNPDDFYKMALVFDPRTFQVIGVVVDYLEEVGMLKVVPFGNINTKSAPNSLLKRFRFFR